MRQLAAQTGCQFVLTGSGAERETIAAMLDCGPRTWSFGGQLDPGELGALIARLAGGGQQHRAGSHCRGARHARGQPVRDDESPAYPWRVAQRVLFHPVPCRNCLRGVCPREHHGCLELLEPETVAAAAALLAATRHRPSHTGEGTGLHLNGSQRQAVPQTGRFQG